MPNPITDPIPNGATVPRFEKVSWLLKEHGLENIADELEDRQTRNIENRRVKDVERCKHALKLLNTKG